MAHGSGRSTSRWIPLAAFAVLAAAGAVALRMFLAIEPGEPAAAAFLPAPSPGHDTLAAAPELPSEPELEEATPLPQPVERGDSTARLKQEFAARGWSSFTCSVTRADSRRPVAATFTAVLESGEPAGLSSFNDLDQWRTRRGRYTVFVDAAAVRIVVAAPNDIDLDDAVLEQDAFAGQKAVAVALPLAHGAVAGRVVDEQGIPHPGVDLRLSGSRRQATSDSLGTFRFAPIRDGSYLVSIPVLDFGTTRPSAQSTKVESAAQVGEPLVFVVPRGAAVAGAVRAAESGEALEGTLVTLRRPGDANTARAARSGPDGAFEFLRLAPGDYVIAAGGGDSGRARLSLALDGLGTSEQRSVELALARGAGEIHGVVREESGSAVPYALVVAERAADDGGRERFSARSDSRGQFRFQGLLPGAWAIRAEAHWSREANWIGAGPTAAAVEAGAVAEVELLVRRGLFLEGRVESASGGSGSLLVRLSGAAGASEQEAGRDGRFAFGGLSPGNYTVEVLDPSAAGVRVLAQRGVFVLDGQKNGVELTVP